MGSLSPPSPCTGTQANSTSGRCLGEASTSTHALSCPLLSLPPCFRSAGAEANSTSGICVGDTGSALFQPGKTAAEDLLVRCC